MIVMVPDSSERLFDVVFENLPTDRFNQKVVPFKKLDDTIFNMRKMILEGRKNPDIVRIARTLTQNIPGRDYDSIVATIYRFLTSRIKYQRDPAGTEWLQDPLVTLRLKSGDCDDYTILGSSLLQALGIQTRIKIAQVHRPIWNHVYFEYFSPKLNTWIPVDASMNKQVGWESPDVINSKVYPVA